MNTTNQCCQKLARPEWIAQARWAPFSQPQRSYSYRSDLWLSCRVPCSLASKEWWLWSHYSWTTYSGVPNAGNRKIFIWSWWNQLCRKIPYEISSTDSICRWWDWQALADQRSASNSVEDWVTYFRPLKRCSLSYHRQSPKISSSFYHVGDRRHECSKPGLVSSVPHIIIIINRERNLISKFSRNEPIH